MKTIIETLSFLLSKEVEEIRSSAKFAETNLYWNAGGFNHKRRIGYLMYLINRIQPETMEDWVIGYFADGNSLALEMLNGECKVKERGRSLKFLYSVALNFKRYLEDSGIKISPEEADKYVLIRVFYETFDGYLREKNTKIALQRFFKHYNIECSNPMIGIDPDILDGEYAVDCLVSDKSQRPICGVQIKSNNFTTMNAVKMNNRKHLLFKEKTGLPVFYIFADVRGHMDKAALGEIHSYLLEQCNEKRVAH